MQGEIMKRKQGYKLNIYDMLRMFHKNELFEAMDKYDKELNEFEKNALETLSGVLYLVESEIVKEV